jgi:hypothetical protein
MQKLVIGLIFLILLILLIGFLYYNKSTDKKILTKTNENLLAGITQTNFSFNNDNEGIKMCSADMLKNTIMSLEPLLKSPSSSSQSLYPNYIKEGLFFIKVGKGLVCDSYRWNLRGSFSMDSNQKLNKSNWDIVKTPEYGVFDYTPDILTNARRRFTDSNSFTDEPHSNEDNPIIIPFLLRFVEKDESGTTNRYVFEIRDARGKYSDFEDYQKVDIFSGNQEGHQSAARYIYSWSAFDTVVNNPSGISTIVEGQSSCPVCDSNWSKDLRRIHDNQKPWRIARAGAVGFTTQYGVTASVGAGYTLDGAKQDIGENDITYFDTKLSSKVHSAKQTTYAYGYLKSVDKSSPAKSRITVEIENGKMFIKNDSGYFFYHKAGTIGNIGRLRCDTLIPTTLNKTNNPGTFECELIPVLDPTLAESYLKTSVSYMKNKWNNNETRQKNLAKFCGNDIRFKDGTLKMATGLADQVSTDRITRAFERICACNMNTQVSPTFYVNALCSDKWIKDNYGIENSSDGKRYDAIRGTLKCNTPPCGFQKCKNLYDGNKNQNGIDFTLYGNPDANEYKDCGSNTMCIVNQTINNSGNIVGGQLNMSAKQQCGGVGGDSVQTVTGSDYEWINITGTQTVINNQGNVSGGNVNIQPSSQTNPITSLPTEIRVTSQNTEFSNLRSPNEQFKIFFNTTDGNISIIKVSDNSTVWSVKGINKFVSGVPPPYKLVQGNDGNIVVYGNQPYPVVFSSADTPQWRRGTVRTPYVTTLSNSGVLETRDGNNTVIWSSQ